MTTNTGGGLVGQLKIDSTGKPYTASGKVSGTDIDKFRKPTTVTTPDTSADTAEHATTTVVVQGTPGRGVSGAAITSNHLILTLSDGTTLDAGLVNGTGIDGVDGTNGTNGVDGANGKTILSGNIDPAGGVGTNGDFYLNLATLDLFGPKGTPSAGWNTPVSIKGTNGAAAPTIASAELDVDGHLVFTMSNAATIDAGEVPVRLPAEYGQTTLPADAADLAGAIALVNAMRQMLIDLGIAKAG